jgi:two-component system chemotaxis response regulator CheY
MDRETRTILLVDGSASIHFYLGLLLKRLEYKVVTAQSAEDALRMMESAVPSIVLSETSLLNMSGTDLLKHMKNSPKLKAVPVVMLTSGSDPALKDACARLGCAAYLFKPVEPDVLYRTLQAVSETIPRANIRLNTSLKVTVGDGSAARGDAGTDCAIAISEGGLYVRTIYPLTQNALTMVRIFLPRKEVTAKAVVLYSFAMAGGPYKEPGMGMKFVEISDTDRGEIRNFIKERLIGDIVPQGI